MFLPFTKMQATGNDFIVLDARLPQQNFVSPGDLSRRLADRRFGVGADQVLFLHNSQSCDWRMQVFNADGSEAEMSGNGMRCFAKFVFDQKIATKPQITVETLAGLIYAEVVDATRGAKASRVNVDMGMPSYLGRKLLTDSRIRHWDAEHLVEADGRAADQIWLHTVSLGNPHAVLFVKDAEAIPLADWGPIVENHTDFPHRTNFEVVSLGATGHVQQRTWERGAGETLACGTGACAVAQTLFVTGRKKQAVSVHLRGGQIDVALNPDGTLRQSGMAELVFVGQWCME